MPTVDVLRRLAGRAASTVSALIREDDGQDLIEYAYLAAFVGVAGYAVLSNIVPEVAATYNA